MSLMLDEKNCDEKISKSSTPVKFGRVPFLRIDHKPDDVPPQYVGDAHENLVDWAKDSWPVSSKFFNRETMQISSMRRAFDQFEYEPCDKIDYLEWKNGQTSEATVPVQIYTLLISLLFILALYESSGFYQDPILSSFVSTSSA